ncbi:MAG: O-antigen ligase family protein [Actinobacteria bacterium]|nr:O-antigen ligase family protein [Actinomycetota bacterium]MBI3687719.1 O-antigen ligase family protein [Actinomycetota bacterium]
MVDVVRAAAKERDAFMKGRLGTGTLKQGRDVWLWAIPAAIAAAAFGWSIGPLGFLAIIAPGLVLYLAGLALTFRFGVLRPVSAEHATRRYLPAAWILLFLVSNQRYFARDPLALASARSSGYSIDNLIEVTAYALVGLAAARMWSAGGRRSYVEWTLAFVPIWAVATAPRSAIVALSVVRAIQLAVPLFLVAATARIVDRPRRLQQFVGTLATAMPRIAVIFVLWGSLVGNYPDNRFTWPGAHPGLSANLFSVSLMLMYFVPRVRTSSVRYERPISAGIMCAALYFNHTRSAIVGALVAILVGSVVCERSLRPPRTALSLLAAAAAAFLWLVDRDGVMAFAVRGEATRDLGELDGRVPVWTFALDQLGGWQDWIFGVGYASIRVLVYPTYKWAGSGHNAWVELLVDVGIPALLAMIGTFLLLTQRLLRRDGGPPSELRGLVVACAVFLLAVSLVSESFAIPGFLFALLVLVSWLSGASTSARGRVTVTSGSTGRPM